jgi:hypothetical protein
VYNCVSVEGEFMGIHYFTEEQMKQLKMNPYVKNVTEKAITYTEEFKEIFFCMYNQGKYPSDILRELHFDVKVLGLQRIKNLSIRIRKEALRTEGFKDTRNDNPGRPATKELSNEELIQRQKVEIEYLKQKVEFLSDLRHLEREAMWKESKSRKKKNSK